MEPIKPIQGTRGFYKFSKREKKPYTERGGLKKIACAFDPETFEQILARAKEQNTSVAEQVRRLTEWGLDSLTESLEIE